MGEELCRTVPEGTLCELIDGETYRLEPTGGTYRLDEAFRPGSTATTSLLAELAVDVAALFAE